MPGFSSHHDLLAVPDAAQVGLVEIGANPHVRGVGHRDHRRARRDELARLDVVREDGAGDRRNEARVVEQRRGERDGGAGLLDAGARLGDLLGPRSGLHELEVLGGLAGARRGDLELGRGGLEFAVGDGLVAEQLLLALEIELGAVVLGLGAVDRGLRGRDLLGPGAGDQVGQPGLGGGELGAAQGELRLLLGVVEPRDELAGGDVVALGHGALDDPAGGLEAELGVVDLEVAGEHELAGAGAVRARTGAGQQAGEGEDEEEGAGAGAVRRRRVFHGLCARRA